MAGEVALIVNPASGAGDHVPEVRSRAQAAGYDVRISDHPGDIYELATQVADDGYDVVVATGGDGTVNEVIRGLIDGEALEEVTLGVVPTGTGNDFAGNIGVTDVPTAFDALAEGERRRIDLGMANGTPFVNSCIAGLTAEASARTSTEMKSRLGVFAYVLTTLRTISEFEGIDMVARRQDDDSTVWEGPAAMVIAGNGRQFSLTGGRQADMEDGVLDVTIIEEAAALDLVGEGTRQRLFDESGDRMTRLLVSELELSVGADDAAVFSLDGEMEEFDSVVLGVQPGALCVLVGAGYDPHPAYP